MTPKLIDPKALFTGLAQAAAIGTFVLVFTMYVDQSVQKEKVSTIEKDFDKLEKRVTNLEAIMPERLQIKE